MNGAEGRLVSVEFVTHRLPVGDRSPCGLIACGCPDHPESPKPEGTYVTLRLDHDVPVIGGRWKLLDADAIPSIHGWARMIADRFGDEWDHNSGCMGDAADSGCPLCRILAATSPNPREDEE